MKEAKVLLLVSFTCANDIVGKKKHKKYAQLKIFTHCWTTIYKLNW